MVFDALGPGAFYDPEQVLLDGVVVVDVTYVGGLVGNRHWGRKLRAGRGTAGKSPIVGATRGGGRMIAMPVAAVSGEILEAFVAATVKEGAVVVTDDYPGYRNLPERFQHYTVSHSTGEYVRGDVYTNTLESAWLMLKRGIIGRHKNLLCLNQNQQGGMAYVFVYRYMIPKHLHRYSTGSPVERI